MFLNSLLFFNLLWIAVAVFAPKNSTAASSITNYTILSKPGCESKCGNVTVPYPFGIGIGTGCALDSPFEINCSTASTPAKAFLGNTSLEVIDINRTEIRVKNVVASRCYNQTGGLIHNNSVVIDLKSRPFAFSDLNTFTVIGCDDSAESAVIGVSNFSKGCKSTCTRRQDVVEDDCSGVGCCQTSIPKGAKRFRASLDSLNNHTKVWHFNECGYAFLGEEKKIRFGREDLLGVSSMRRTMESVPVVLDWAIGNLSCAQAQTSNAYSCQQNSECNDSDSGLGGYTCSCREGYEGNPYLSPGCHDIDECEDRNKNPCGANSICKNNPGNYSCSCKPRYYSPKGQRVCIHKNSIVIKLSVGMSFGFLGLSIGISWLYLIIKRRKLA